MRTLLWRRWIGRGLAGAGALVVVVVATALVLLSSLDRPWIKSRIQAIARTSGGVEIDYREGHVGWLSGIDLQGLVVQSPPEVRRFAPDLVRVDRMKVAWSLGGLLLGHGLAVPRAAISGVTLTVVVDENERTSFDALSPSHSPPKPPPAPPVPLSQQAATYLASVLPIGEFDLDDFTVQIVRTDHGDAIEQSELRGLAISVIATAAEPPTKGARVQLALGSPAKPLELALTRAPSGVAANSARARFSLTVDATSAAVHAALDLRMLEQTFAASVAADHWLHAEANVAFDPTAGRTNVTLEHGEAGDGAARVDALVEIPDSGDPLVRRGHADIDVARILKWLPAGMVPVTAERAHLGVRVESLVAGSPVRLAEGGSAAADVALANVDVTTSGKKVHVSSAELSLGAKPVSAGAVEGHASLKIGALTLASGEDGVEAQELGIDADGAQAADGGVTGHLGFRFAHVVHAGAVPVVADGGQIDLRLQGLHLDAKNPIATRGDVALSVQVASLDARPTGSRVITDRLSLTVHTALEGHAPYRAEIETKMARLRAFGASGKPVVDAPAHIELHAEDVQPDMAAPATSRAVIHAKVGVGDLQTSLDATKAADAVDYDLQVSIPSLKMARPVLPPALLNAAPWDAMAVTFQSKGHVDHLGGDNPFVRHATELDVDRVGYANVAARRVSLSVKSQGTATQHQGDVDLRALGLAFNGGAASDDHLTLSAKLDRGRPSLEFQIATEGRMTTKGSGSCAFDAAHRVIVYSLDVHLGGLAPVAPFAATIHGLDAIDLTELGVSFSAHGALSGVVDGVAPDGTVRLAPGPEHSAALEGTADLDVTHLHWAHGDNAVITPSVKWHGEMHGAEGRRTLDSRLEIRSLHLDLGSNDVDLNGVLDVAKIAVAGSLAEPSDVQVAQDLSIAGVTQDLVPEYPVGGLGFSLSAERGSEGILHISNLKFTNDTAGTAVGLTGNVATANGRRTLSVTTTLTQDLGKLSTLPERFKGTGNVTVDANVTTPDYSSHLDVKALVKGAEVSAVLPRSGIELEGFNGEVPVSVALDLTARGVALEHSDKRSPYSMLRFTDQHPLLTRSGFLSITRIKTPWVTIAPLVGNLEIDQNVISLRQFEMGVRGGTITGQCGVVWDGAKSTVELHVRASGVQSSHGEPFDGNIEVAISAADRTVEGRAEILRIGERHLLDLLDLEDPLHVDPTMNRVRWGLNFGYPDNLRLVFDHGFASVHLELGGLARLISIGDMKGIPMGPIIDHVLTPTKDTP
jgi:translocation and assembly module TamB